LTSQPADQMTAAKLDVLCAAAIRPDRPGARRIVFRFATSPVDIAGRDRVEAVVVRRNRLVEQDGVVRAVATDELDTIDTGLLLRSIGYRGAPVPGLPFDEATGTIPHEGGRVSGLPGAYVAGWIKRGPSGFIGTNKSCAQETVDHLVADLNAGRLAEPTGSARTFDAIVRSRVVAPIDVDGWRSIDRRERSDGLLAGRVRRKLVRLDSMLDAAGGAPARRRGRLRRGHR
jgi:ferredoxin--NADP+ reductase